MEALRRVPEFYSVVPKNITDIYDMACEYYGPERVQLNIGVENYSTNMWEGTFMNFATISNATEEMLDNIEPFIYDNSWPMYTLMIHWPEITVMNELSKSHDMNDLFVKVPLKTTGQLSSNFQLLKTTYTKKELNSNYLHSHCHGLTSIYSWETPCLGTGPIRNTQTALLMDYNPERFKLFLWELDKMVHTESLTGIPYIHLEDIGKSSETMRQLTQIKVALPDMNYDLARKFVVSYLKTFKMKFSVRNNHIVLGMPFMDWYVGFSEYFINWINRAKRLSRNCISLCDEINDMYRRMTYKYVIKGVNLYTLTSRRASRFESSDGEFLLKFHGKNMNFEVLDDYNNIHRVTLMNVNYAYAMLVEILDVLNSNYKQLKEHEFGNIGESTSKALPISF